VGQHGGDARELAVEEVEELGRVGQFVEAAPEGVAVHSGGGFRGGGLVAHRWHPWQFTGGAMLRWSLTRWPMSRRSLALLPSAQLRLRTALRSGRRWFSGCLWQSRHQLIDCGSCWNTTGIS